MELRLTYQTGMKVFFCRDRQRSGDDVLHGGKKKKKRNRFLARNWIQ